MKQVKFDGFPWVGNGNYSDTFETWVPGCVKLVSESEAGRLVTSFPGYFRLLESVVEALEVMEPEAVLTGDLPGEGVDTVILSEPIPMVVELPVVVDLAEPIEPVHPESNKKDSKISKR